MYETLRLASPAPLFVKTPLIPVDLDITTPSGPRTITVKPGTLMGSNQYGAHLSPRWGPSAQSFNPKRFITTSTTGAEKFEIPEGAMFCAWQIGGRTCPAKKFSQVEFAGIMAELLREWRVEICEKEGESLVDARDRVRNVLMNERYFNISARLKRPEAAGLRFVRR
jgi:cytochrome P450